MSSSCTPTRDELRWMYTRMVLSRRYEDFMKLAYLEDKVPVFNMARGPIPGEMHLSSGQEPCAVGVCVHLDGRDAVMSSHRPHHVAIAQDVDLNAMTAEIFGKKTGLGGGRGGHMHLFAPDAGFSCTGIVGQCVGVAAGHALAAQLEKTGGVGVSICGEGGANQGLFHETMNLAALWKLPFICVFEDNAWGVSVSKQRSTAVARNSDRAAAYGCAGEYVDDNDVWGVYAAAKRAVERARAGEGPTIIEIRTERLEGHFVGDPETYVPKAELDARKDPIDVMGARLIDQEGFTTDELAAINAEAIEKVRAAETFARTSPYPDGREALDAVFV